MIRDRGDAHAVVVGGGLAGLAAALRLADGGMRVTLLESRPRLGGATHSFQRDIDGGTLTVDNGQHVFLRCCTAYRTFLRRLDVERLTTLQPRLDVPVLRPDADQVRRGRLRRDRLPAPLHLARALAGYRLLTPSDRVRAIRGALALRLLRRDAPGVDDRTFADWLLAHGQTDTTIERLWDVVTVATLNAPARTASLTLGAKVFQTGLLTRAGAADVGLPSVPLGHLHGDAARRALQAAGATVRTGARVRAVEPQAGGGFTVRLGADAESLHADAVVLAVPHDTAADLLPAAAGVDTARLRALGTCPILNVHVVYDRAVMVEPFVAAVGTPAQWIFDRTAHGGLTQGQYLAVSVSAADGLIDQPVAALRELFLPELTRLFPAARSAKVREFFVTRERTATFRQIPGTAALRPGSTTRLPGLSIAGAWTHTDWPATMEGAVRSGVAAAHATLSNFDARPGGGPPAGELAEEAAA